jgi:hypothetical protein
MPNYLMFLGGATLASSVQARTTGLPTSPNEASSLHLVYPPTVAVELQVTVEVMIVPTSNRIVFWAVQPDLISSSGTSLGVSHFGLQWQPSHPNSRAVNWGGYDSATGSELSGSVSSLPSATGNPNTRDFQWLANRQYRYRVWSPSVGVWRGEIRDLVTSTTTVVRELSVPGSTLLRGAVLFTESFEVCQNSSAVKWTNLQFTLANASLSTPASATASYALFSDGACTNTNQLTLGGGIVQTTGTARTTVHGTSMATS